MTKAFNGDEILLQRVKGLVAKHEVETVVETGTYQGDTTEELVNILLDSGVSSPMVISIDINHEYHKQSKKRLENKFGDNASFLTLLKGSSPSLLPQIIVPTHKTLFFLDAHWNSYNPLIDELKAIAAAGIKPVILIHDFFVPGKSTTPGAAWGYDTYGGQDYKWEWIAPHVEAIYPNGFIKSYNDDYTASRGCLILEPK